MDGWMDGWMDGNHGAARFRRQKKFEKGNRRCFSHGGDLVGMVG
jgi:hypothetical protein